MKGLAKILAVGAAALFSLQVSAVELSESDLAKGVTEVVEVRAVMPEYPQEALFKGKEGAVLLSYSINEKGVPFDVEVIKVTGSNAFINPSVRALAKSRFSPALLNGNPISVSGLLRRYNYKLVSGDQLVMVNSESNERSI